MKPVVIDLSGLEQQFSLAVKDIDLLTETCVNAVTAAIYANWEKLANERLNSTLPDYVKNLSKVDKGRFEKQIILSGVLPNMIEQGATPFDMKENFKKSAKVKYTIPVYNAKGNQVKQGGQWYLTIPFRHGTPGIVGQAGFANEMPNSVYNVIKKKSAGNALTKAEIPSPHDVPKSREAILDSKGNILYDEYVHKNSIYEGMTKRRAQYEKVKQNTYGTFRRAGENSDPLSWIHKGIKAYRLADEAVQMTDIDTIVNNEVVNYLENAI